MSTNTSEGDALRKKRIVFFDGECGFCKRSIRFLAKIDRNRVLSFAPRKGEAAKLLLPSRYTETGDIQTLLYLRPGQTEPFIYSDATLQALFDIGGVWRWLSSLRMIPRCIRDVGYKFIARNRHRISKLLSPESCVLPFAEDRERYLP